MTCTHVPRQVLQSVIDQLDPPEEDIIKGLVGLKAFETLVGKGDARFEAARLRALAADDGQAAAAGQMAQMATMRGRIVQLEADLGLRCIVASHRRSSTSY